MATQPDSALTVRFSQLGRDEKRFTSWSLDSAYLVSTDSFSFELFTPKREDGFDLEMQPVELLLNGVSQIFGRIDKTRTGGSPGVVSCSGRDYIADLVECNVDPGLKIALNTQLADALQAAMGPCGITSIVDFENILFSEIRTGKKIKRTKRKRKKRPIEDYKPKPGEGIYEFCNRLVARHGATIQPSQTRNEVVIDSPDYTQSPMFTLTRTDDPTNSAANNVISGEADRDFSSFPTYTLFTGTAGSSGKPTTAASKTFDIFEAVAKAPALLKVVERGSVSGRWQTGEVADGVRDGGLLYRLLYHRDAEARGEDDLANGLRRAVAERLKDSLAYTCTVAGHTDRRTGAIYSVNTMADVDDAIANVHEPLWISKRTLKYSDSEGPTTDLELWRPESFQIGDDDE